MITRESILEKVRVAVGDGEYRDEQDRWERVAREDLIALEKALRDLAAARSTVRNPGGWLMGAWASQRRLQLAHEDGTRANL